MIGAQRRKQVRDEWGLKSIDGGEACAMLRQAGGDALEEVKGVMEVGSSVRSRNLTSGVVSYGPESCET